MIDLSGPVISFMVEWHFHNTRERVTDYWIPEEWIYDYCRED